MAGLDAELDAALRAMQSSFHVRLIGTFMPDLICAPADKKATTWLAKNCLDFDQFPVREGDATIGILPRQKHPRKRTVRQVMQPLSERIIVSADMPIADLIPQLRDSHYRLILRGGRIDGLVTQSDLLKLPVRMLVFGLISHLEMCLRQVVLKRVPWPKWLAQIVPERRKAIRAKLKELRGSRLEPDPLEFTNFGDVVEVLSSQPDFGDNFRKEGNLIRNLRNDIAHSKTYISSAADVRDFVDRFNCIRKLIDRVSPLLKAAQ